LKLEIGNDTARSIWRRAARCTAQPRPHRRSGSRGLICGMLREQKVLELARQVPAEFPYTAIWAHAANDLFARRVSAVTIVAPPGHWIGTGEFMIAEQTRPPVHPATCSTRIVRLPRRPPSRIVRLRHRCMSMLSLDGLRRKTMLPWPPPLDVYVYYFTPDGRCLSPSPVSRWLPTPSLPLP
jgi:hypothetical protein